MRRIGSWRENVVVVKLVDYDWNLCDWGTAAAEIGAVIRRQITFLSSVRNRWSEKGDSARVWPRLPWGDPEMECPAPQRCDPHLGTARPSRALAWGVRRRALRGPAI